MGWEFWGCSKADHNDVSNSDDFCPSCHMEAQRAEIDHLNAEVERLRALCAARPKINIPWTMNTISEHNKAYVEWAVKIDAAGRGEGGE